MYLSVKFIRDLAEGSSIAEITGCYLHLEVDLNKIIST